MAAPAPSPSTAAIPSAQATSKTVYLKDLPLNSSDGAFGEWSSRPSKIHTELYRNVFRGSSYCGGDIYRDYELPKRYSRFTAIVGVADDSPDPQELTFYVEVNGARVVDEPVPVGAQHPIDITLGASAVRLKIGIENPCDETVGVWANARLES
jgi:hypothetical protein